MASKAKSDEQDNFVLPHAMLDPGHRYFKWIFTDGKSTLGPSKFPSIYREVQVGRIKINDRSSVLIEILSSSTGLSGCRFFGDGAKGSPQSISAGKQDKLSLQIAPWLLFAAMGLAVPRGKGYKSFSFNSETSLLSILIPSPEIKAKNKKYLDAISGEHRIRVTRQGERAGSLDIIEGHVIINGTEEVALCAEGSMAFTFCQRQGLLKDIPKNSTLVILNVGHGTAICSLLTSNGELKGKREVTPGGGCSWLIDTICDSNEMKDLVIDVVDVDLVIQGIMDRNDNLRTAYYGQPGRLNFYEIYESALQSWQRYINSLLYQFVDPATRMTVAYVIPVGKPVELFNKEYLAPEFEFLEIPSEFDPQYFDVTGMCYDALDELKDQD